MDFNVNKNEKMNSSTFSEIKKMYASMTRKTE